MVINLPSPEEILVMMSAELSGEAEMPIRTEGLSKVSQGQRIDILKTFQSLQAS